MLFFSTCVESAIRSLIIGNYSSVSRSLRWIIDSAVFWTDMQSDYATASAIYEHYSNSQPMDNREYSYLLRHTTDLNYELLEERLSLKDRWKKYTIGDILIIQLSAIKRLIPKKNISDIAQSIDSALNFRKTQEIQEQIEEELRKHQMTDEPS
ncbi:MAG: hypothetical protein WA323_14355 [Candidatus Nitrosopolaris sp.]